MYYLLVLNIAKTNIKVAIGKYRSVNDHKRRQSDFHFECTAFGEFALSSSWLGEDVFAVVAGDDGLGMAEDDCSLVAASTLDIHEV